MSIQFKEMRDRLHQFDFGGLFVENLGWSRPPIAEKKWRTVSIKDDSYERRAVAGLGGVMVFEVRRSNGRIPDAEHRKQIFRDIEKQYHEHLLIFLDGSPELATQSLWYWVKRDGKQLLPREHLYIKHQHGDSLIGKLQAMHFDINELDKMVNAPVGEVAERLKRALDVEKVTTEFYKEFETLHENFLRQIKHVSNRREKQWYASVLLNRLMFVYFLQDRGFMLDDGDYLQHKLDESKALGKDRFYKDFLCPLFFEGFAKKREHRDPDIAKRIGDIRYLNGGLFLKHPIEEKNLRLDVPDAAFEETFALFKKYDWTLDDTVGGDDRFINPDILGYIFEKYINQKEFGAYYTLPQLTQYLCEKTIHQVLLDRVNGVPPFGPTFTSFEALILNLDDTTCRRLWRTILPSLHVLDPACGSGAFLVAAMKTLIAVYAAVIGRIKVGGDRDLKAEIAELEQKHPSLGYFMHRQIMTHNLFGVDVMEEATEIAKLRLFLALVGTAETVDQLEPLPNIDFNILAGNSLLGLLHVKDADFNRHGAQGDLFRPTYAHLVAERHRLIGNYRDAKEFAPDALTALRDNIEEKKQEAGKVLDQILLEAFQRLKIKFEQATWDEKKQAEGKSKVRPLKLADMKELRPFHWGYEFAETVNDLGGFDVIIMNPPWDAFKPDDKEFFLEHSDTVSKKKMTVKEFEEEKKRLLEDEDIRKAYCEYLSQFPHVSAYFRSAPEYAHQASVVNEKRVGTDTNLYKLFVEQCFSLLRPGGQAGMVVPAGLYNDQGAKALREMLFTGGKVRALFGFSNEKFLFEEVHHSVKFCVVVFGKGGTTQQFDAAFRINPREAVKAEELEVFLRNDRVHMQLTPELIRKLSPSTMSIMEFRDATDISIAEKMMQFPALEEKSDVGWTLALTREFDMSVDSDLFETQPGPGRLPLYEGKMMNQYQNHVAKPKYWLDEKAARARLVGKRQKDTGQSLDYQQYRIAFRKVARNTDERTLIATIVPKNVFCPDSLTLEKIGTLDVWSRFYLLGLFNSFPIDYLLRQRVNNNVSFFFVYNLPIPRLRSTEAKLRSISLRAAKLVCTTEEFDELAREVGLRDHRDGAADYASRMQLRAEIDGLVAHLYGLTEKEFLHIQATFPVVPDPAKVAAHNAYRDIAAGVIS